VISHIPSSGFANTVAPFAPVGRAPVSQESTDLKSSSFRPPEQLAESGRTLNRRFPDERPNDDVERDRLERGTQDAAVKTSNNEEQLKAEREQIQELAARDREVRAHEQAHASVAGQYAKGTSYTYQRGPDGVSYAVGGEVQIDTSPIPGDPEATLRKAQQLRRAANAPADPSSQDARVAALAAQMEQQARVEVSEQQAIESEQRAAGVEADARGQAAPVNELQQRDAQRTEADKESEARKERLTEDERRLQADQQRFEVEQRQLDQRQARAELFNETARRNIDINRRLLEIGVFGVNPTVGSLFNKTV
jgi:hypothetical protein